ncbi:MAG: biotin--[acetyl-CoA-carboxylase] ligase [Pseudomonadota bacterium]
MSAWPAGWGRLEIATTDSTNAEAARRLAETDPPFWLRADRQTAARGRRGRAWAMAAGNFAASAVLTPPGGPAAAALRSFTASLALAEAFEALGVARDALALKWPNDVLLDGGKVAGILLETVPLTPPQDGVSLPYRDPPGRQPRIAPDPPPGRARLRPPSARARSSSIVGGATASVEGHGAPGTALIVGVGVNLAAAPPAGDLEPHALPPTALADHGLTATPADLLAALAPAFAAWESLLCAQGFGPVRTAWLGRAARLGQHITARLPRESLTGTFASVDDTGAIVLDTAQGRRHLAAADVFFGNQSEKVSDRTRLKKDFGPDLTT